MQKNVFCHHKFPIYPGNLKTGSLGLSIIEMSIFYRQTTSKKKSNKKNFIKNVNVIHFFLNLTEHNVVYWCNNTDRQTDSDK